MEARNTMNIVILIQSERNAIQRFLARVANETIHMVHPSARSQKFVTDRSIARSTLFQRVLIARFARRLIVNVVERCSGKGLRALATLEAIHVEDLIHGIASWLVTGDFLSTTDANIDIHDFALLC